MKKKGVRGQGSIVGLVGGIGSGKSTVAGEMRRLGMRVIDADRIAHGVLGLARIAREIRKRWPAAVVNGRVDRRRLARAVFTDPRDLRRLERIVHPGILREMRQLLGSHRRARRGVVIDAPLLLEAGLDRLCDALVFIEAPRQVRIRRAKRERGWTAAELSARERRQGALAKKRGACGFMLYNAGSRKAVRKETLRVLEAIRTLL